MHWLRTTYGGFENKYDKIKAIYSIKSSVNEKLPMWKQQTRGPVKKLEIKRYLIVLTFAESYKRPITKCSIMKRLKWKMLPNVQRPTSKSLTL